MTETSEELKSIYGNTSVKNGGIKTTEKGILGGPEQTYNGVWIDGAAAKQIAKQMPESLELFEKNSEGKYIIDKNGNFFINTDNKENIRLISGLDEKLKFHKISGIALNEIEITNKDFDNNLQNYNTRITIPAKYFGNNKPEIDKNLEKINSHPVEHDLKHVIYIEPYFDIRNFNRNEARVAILGGEGNFSLKLSDILLNKISDITGLNLNSSPEKVPTVKDTYNTIKKELGDFGIKHNDQKNNNFMMGLAKKVSELIK